MVKLFTLSGLLAALVACTKVEQSSQAPEEGTRSIRGGTPSGEQSVVKLTGNGGLCSGTLLCPARPGLLKVPGWRDGKDRIMDLAFFAGRIAQHEIDHLNGVLITDYRK